MTDEEWAAIKPMAEAKVRAQEALNNWLATNQPRDERLRIESQILGIRLRAELDAAESALALVLWPTVKLKSTVFTTQPEGGEDGR